MDTIARWRKKIDEYKTKIKSGEKLTQEEKDDWDFMEQKMDDWESDMAGEIQAHS
jgi:hypothetical protein